MLMSGSSLPYMQELLKIIRHLNEPNTYAQ